MIKNRHIYQLQWLLCSILTMLFSACSSSDAEVGDTHKQAKLAIYVYAPEQAAQTRADVGEVDPITDEGTIKSLQIWIYESVSGAYVGYFITSDVAALNEGQGTTYQLPVSDDFANRKPNVDVYVLANVKAANCGVSTLNEETSRANLMTGARIASDHFGLGDLVKNVPDEGLPMTGMLTTKPVVGDAPALRVGSMSAVSTVQLTRAVSKLRFVFAKTENQPKVTITSIKMNAGMIPDVEYFFDKTQALTYNTSAGELLSLTIDDIAETADPTNYLYLGQEAQAYENLINEAANKQEPEKPEVTVYGPIYLRESDKRLAGKITYTIGEGTEQTADFQMQQAGDFNRNHTWIVYAYYAGSGNLHVQTIYVKNWSNREISHELYNW